MDYWKATMRSCLPLLAGWMGLLGLAQPAEAAAAQGLQWLVFTDISRDGLQSGLNLQATVGLARESGLKVIASGGVSRLEDVKAAREAGLAGVIVGRALYEGSIDPALLFQIFPGSMEVGC